MSNQTTKRERHFIYIANFLSTISFAMFFSSLTLYLNEYLHFSFTKSSLISGVYFSVHFMMPLLGSFLINRYFSPRVLILTSSLSIALGSLLIYLHQADLLYIGLSFAMFGSGLSSISINCYINQRLQDHHLERDRLFHYSYSFTNAGFLLGFGIGGYFEVAHLYAYLYLISTIVSTSRAVLVLSEWRTLKVSRNEKAIRPTGILIASIIPLIGVMAYRFVELTPTLLFTLAVLGIIYMWKNMIQNSSQQERQRIWTFSIFYLGSLIYWMVYYTGPMGVTLFIKHNVNRMVHGIEIAPQWLFNINAILTMSLAPIAVYLRQRSPLNQVKNLTAKQFSLALIILGISFGLFSVGIKFADSNGFSPLSPTILHFFCQSVSEVLLAPIGISLVARYIPENYQNTIMGFWMMIGGIATTCSSHFSSWMNIGSSTTPASTNLSYQNVFNKLTLLAIFASILLKILFSHSKELLVRTHPSLET
jgi:POT family proton-dependent oligopeptide transporter